jgi:hypothetical protein
MEGQKASSELPGTLPRPTKAHLLALRRESIAVALELLVGGEGVAGPTKDPDPDKDVIAIRMMRRVEIPMVIQVELLTTHLSVWTTY